jgi:hypothetical protein
VKRWHRARGGDRGARPLWFGRCSGDPIYNAGDALGRLLRTLYLCDYLSNPMFRTEVLDLFNQGEAVHSLQRAIHNGMITAKQGRTTEELGTISGALTLLANIVMAWNTHHLQVMLDRAPADHPDEVITRPRKGLERITDIPGRGALQYLQARN